MIVVTVMLFACYWIVLGVMIDGLGSIEGTTFELFSPTLRDARYFYLLPFFAARISLLLASVLLASLCVAGSLLTLLFPLEIASVTSVIVPSLAVSFTTLLLVNVMYKKSGFAILIVCLLCTTLSSYVVTIAWWRVVAVTLLLLAVEVSHFAQLQTLTHNQREWFFMELVPFSIIVPFLVILVARVIFGSGFMFALFLVASSYFLLAGTLGKRTKSTLVLYRVRGWLIATIAVILAAMYVAGIDESIFVGVSWIVVRLGVKIISE